MVEVAKSRKTPIMALPGVENELFWQHHIELFKRSGLKRAKYCRVNKINYDRFGYWLRKSTKPVARLVAVKVKQNNEPKSHVSPLCILNLRNGGCLMIHDLQALSVIIEKVV